MKSLFRYEFQKLIRSKTCIITMIVGLLICVISCVVSILQTVYSETKEQDIMKSRTAIHEAMKADNARTDTLTNEYLQRVLQDYQKKVAVPHPGDADFEFWQGYEDQSILYLIGRTCLPNGEIWEWTKLKEIKSDDSFDFYGQRRKRIEETLNTEYEHGGYTVAEKEFWLNKEAKVTTPIAWGGKQAWSLINYAIGMIFFQLVIICICVAPVFAMEYHQHTDAVLLTTKYGKSKLIIAKIMAAIAFAFTYMLGIIFITMIIMISIAGIQGYDLPLQLWSMYAPYNCSIGQMVAVETAIILLIGIALGAFNAFLSARTKSSFTTFIFDVIVVLGPAFIPYSNQNRYFNQVLDMCPIQCISIVSNTNLLNSYQFGSLIITDISMTIIVYSIITILSIGLAINGFRKHQVQNLFG